MYNLLSQVVRPKTHLTSKQQMQFLVEYNQLTSH